MEDNFVLIEFRQNELPGTALVNVATGEYAQSNIYNWQLSVLIQCEQLGENGMPSPLEQELLDQFEDRLQPMMRDQDNGIFLGRVTCDGQRELMWRVKDPELPHTTLHDIIESADHPRPFDYRIDPDPSWDKAAWYLENAAKQK